uniref:apolipoprotein N-acyltransferase n=1 Tax=Shimia aestuarii TaxID=254406 RepID=UPI001FB1B9C6
PVLHLTDEVHRVLEILCRLLGEADDEIARDKNIGPRRADFLDLGGVGQALPLICYEVVFPQDVRGAPARPRLLMQITNDAWFGTFSGPFQHLQQARMRAIEMGLPLVRAANTGVSAVIDARGRVVAALGLDEAGYIDAGLPAARAETVYAKIGDMPFAALMGLLLALTLWRRRGKSD